MSRARWLVSAEEAIYTARETATAEREKSIELITTAQAGEKEALRLHLSVQAELQVASARGDAVRAHAQADADADADSIRAQAPLVDSLLKEIGVDAGSAEKITRLDG